MLQTIELSEVANEAYQKPEIVAENKAEGTFASGCPTHDSSVICTACEMKS